VALTLKDGRRCVMIIFVIRLNRLNGFEIVVNPELIEWIESTPDTTLTLATGSTVIVKNSIEDVIQKILEYRKTLSASGSPPAKVLLETYKRERA